jgi:hypothetical protein
VVKVTWIVAPAPFTRNEPVSGVGVESDDVTWYVYVPLEAKKVKEELVPDMLTFPK